MIARSLTAAALGLVVLTGPPTPAWAAGTAAQATWHGKQARIYGAQSAGHGGAGILVAVLDGWVDVAHPDFEGRASAGVDCVGGSCVLGQSRDSCWHGTHVAGLVGSSSFGVAPRANILPVQVLTADPSGVCTGSADDVAAGIRYAADAGARILNLSLGADLASASTTSAITTAVQYAVSKNALVVFSAGNDDAPMADSYGGGALIVAATAPDGRLANYSQHGTGVSLAAPGGQGTGPSQNGKASCAGQSDCVTSLLSGSRYGVAAGTSMAAPQVSGTAALLLGQNPTWGRDQVAQRLTSTARPLAQAGAGLLDASAALGVPASAAPTTRSAPAITTPANPPAPHPSPSRSVVVHARKSPASPLPVPASAAAVPVAATEPAAAASSPASSSPSPSSPSPSSPSPSSMASAIKAENQPAAANAASQGSLPARLPALALGALLVAGAAAGGGLTRRHLRR